MTTSTSTAAGFRTVTPFIIHAEAPELVDFLQSTFGAEELKRSTADEAYGFYSEVRIGDTVILIGGGTAAERGNLPSALHVYVEDCDAAYGRALSAGAVTLMGAMGEPAGRPYGERSAFVQDAFGNYWYIATGKGKTYIPEGANNVNVYLHPLRAEPVISFLKRAFGARELMKYASPDGVVHHAEIRVGSSMVEMGEAHGKYQPMQPMFYLYVPDVDRVYQSALGAGATSISPPVDQPYGDRSGGVKDAFGSQWYIATHIKDV